MTKCCALLVSLLLLTGCDGGASDDTAPGPVLQGNWQGLASFYTTDGHPTGNARITLYLTQKGGNLSGTGVFEPEMVVGNNEPPTFPFEGTYNYPSLEIRANVPQTTGRDAWSFVLECTVESPSSLACTFEGDGSVADIELAQM